MKTSTCKICLKVFNKRPDSKGTYCSNPCRIEGSKLDRIERNRLYHLNNELLYNITPNHCNQCASILPYTSRKQNFCSYSCSASYHNALRGPMDTTQRIKLQQALTVYHTNNPKEKKLPSLHKLSCVICSTPFEHVGKRKTCSVECHKEISSLNGRKNAANRKSRSKDEIELYELCNSYYTNVSHNTVIADGWDADIILNDHNTAILWNGPWHYQDMQLSNHSLLQVQTRDKKKIKLFESLGWSVVIFEDRYYTPAQAFELLKRKISGAT